MRVISWQSFRRRLLPLALAAVLVLGVVPASAVEYGDVVPADAYEPDGTPLSASPLSVGAEPQHHTLHELSDNDWVRFYMQGGSTYVIETSAPFDAIPVSLYEGLRPANTDLVLFADDGTTQLDYNDDSGDYSGSSRIVWKAKTSGYALARVTVGDGDGEADVKAMAPAKSRDGEIGQYLISVKKKAPSIMGTVTDESGAPIQGASVYLYEADLMPGAVKTGEMSAAFLGGYRAETDDRGRYYFFDLGDADWVAEFDAYEYIGEFWDDQTDPEEADVITTTTGDTVANIDVVLAEMPPDITGVVRNEDGDVLSGQRVTLHYNYGYGWYEHSSTYTDEDGVYGFCDLYSGYEYRVEFTGGNAYESLRFVPEYWDDEPYFADAHTMGAPFLDSADATLTAIPPVVSGRVTDEAGDPVPGIFVEAYGEAYGDYLGWAMTDESGDYVFTTELFSDETTVAISFYDDYGNYKTEWYDDQPYFDEADLVVASPEDPATGIDAVLERQDPDLGGTVVDEATGKPIEGVEAWLYFRDEERNEWRVFDYAFTDEAGEYGFWGLWDDGPYRLRFFDRSETYASEYYDDAPTFNEAEDIWLGGFDRLTLGIGGTVEADAALALKIPRVAGSTRYTTAIAAAKSAFPNWDDVGDVVIASGDDAHMVDALSASGLCWAFDAPLLLVRSDSAPAEVLAAVREMKAAAGGPIDVHIVGDADAVAASVAASIQTASGGKLERISGGNRYLTAAAVAARVRAVAADTERELPMAALVANGAENDRLWDALAFSAVSAENGIPVLLTKADTVPAETLAALKASGATDVIVGGGKPSVSDAAFKALGADSRWSGADRYATAASIAEGARAKGWLTGLNVGISASLPDALTGGSLVGRTGGVLLLTRKDSLPSPTGAYLTGNAADILSCRIFGGATTVSEAVRDQVTNILDQ